MRTSMVLYLTGVALAQGGLSVVGSSKASCLSLQHQSTSLITPTIETNSVGVATGVASTVTSINGTTVQLTSASNGTTGVNGTGLASGGSQPTAAGSASVSGGSGSTGAAAVMKPMVGIGAAGAVFALLL